MTVEMTNSKLEEVEVTEKEKPTDVSVNGSSEEEDNNDFFNRLFEIKVNKFKDEDKSNFKDDMIKINYLINDNTCFRFELIKLLEDDDDKIKATIQLIKDEGYDELLHMPDEFLEWYARLLLNIPFTRKDIEHKHKEYKIDKEQFKKNLVYKVSKESKLQKQTELNETNINKLMEKLTIHFN